MGCNCKWTEIIIAIIIFVTAMWPNFFGSASRWITVIAAIALFLHAILCKNCGKCMPEKAMTMPAKTTAKRSTTKKKKKRR